MYAHLHRCASSAGSAKQNDQAIKPFFMNIKDTCTWVRFACR